MKTPVPVHPELNHYMTAQIGQSILETPSTRIFENSQLCYSSNRLCYTVDCEGINYELSKHLKKSRFVTQVTAFVDL